MEHINHVRCNSEPSRTWLRHILVMHCHWRDGILFIQMGYWTHGPLMYVCQLSDWWSWWAERPTLRTNITSRCWFLNIWFWTKSCRVYVGPNIHKCSRVYHHVNLTWISVFFDCNLGLFSFSSIGSCLQIHLFRNYSYSNPLLSAGLGGIIMSCWTE